ncbi:hypothetical protein SRABI133_04415 [Peribacillus simplex]|uniref:Uncharacterized protein n=1 Tax=Peribacillus simplex TaxID=1478 RepID=A0A9W4L4Q8_9BACI|nr:hypothetical protein SRABI133_04415 [Peribacillus simplex]
MVYCMIPKKISASTIESQKPFEFFKVVIAMSPLYFFSFIFTEQSLRQENQNQDKYDESHTIAP